MERDLAEEPRVAGPLDATHLAGGSQRARLAFALTAVLLACVIAGLVIWSRNTGSARGTVLAGINTIGVLPIVDPTVDYSIGMVIPQRDPMTPLIAALVQIAREVAPTLES